jgi:hypothetical protein
MFNLQITKLLLNIETKPNVEIVFKAKYSTKYYGVYAV